ncbi:DEKNAAC104099 [Brettanomyces naardenensis]|uniref:Protein transport protein BOS1 n=1 Tax=Brettanomyces naardenensis TaxID=13370 RepID=A0A448YQD8_BRENA|nr:DEKNAAC104099 [Brettanomyces naardenensis]
MVSIERYLQSLLYNNATRLTQQLRKDLEQFAKDPSTAAPALIGQITTTINNLGRTLRDYEEFINNQTLSLNESQKLKNQNRLTNLKKEYSEYKVKFASLRKQREDSQAESSRNQLFSNRSTAISDNPYDENSMSIRQGHASKNGSVPSDSGLSMQEGLYKEQSVLERSNQQLDDILEMGRQAFDDLVEQNEIVGKMRDRMSSSLETMGVSRATIRKIEKKAFEDKWIFYIGGGTTLFSMYMIWHYLG